MKTKNKLSFSVLSVILAIVISVTGVSALFTALAHDGVSGTAGTVRIDNINLRVEDVSPAASGTGLMGKSITNWNPGDINLVEWDVINLGNKSVCTRNTMFLYWDEENDPRELGILYIYPANMSDEDILADMLSDNPSKFVGIGDDLKRIKNPEDETRYGYIWTFLGDILDGVGLGAETGDAREVDYNTTGYPRTTDDDSATMDHVAFKLAFAPEVLTEYMGKLWIMEVVTEAMQARNTSNNDWAVAATDIIGMGQLVVPEYDEKNDGLDPLAAISKAPYFVSVDYGAKKPTAFDSSGIPEAFANCDWPGENYQLSGTPRNSAGRYNARADVKLELLAKPTTDVSFDMEFANKTTTTWEIGNFRQYLYDASNEVNWVIVKDSILYYPEDAGSITLAPGESVILRGYTKNLKYITTSMWYAGIESKYRCMFDCWESGNKAETLFTPYADAKIAYLMPMARGTGSLALSVIDVKDDSIVTGGVFTLQDSKGNTVNFTLNSNGIYMYDPDGKVSEINVDSADAKLGKLPAGDYQIVKVSLPEGYIGAEEPIDLAVVEGMLSNEYVEVMKLTTPLKQVSVSTTFEQEPGESFPGAHYEIYATTGDLTSGKPVRFTKKANGSFAPNPGGKSTVVSNETTDPEDVYLPPGDYIFKPVFVGDNYIIDDFEFTVPEEGEAPLVVVESYYIIKAFGEYDESYVLATNGWLYRMRSGPKRVFSDAVDYVYTGRGYWEYVLKSDGTVASARDDNLVTYDDSSGIKTLTGVVQIDGGYGSGYALKDDGTVWAWGYNQYGQLGNGTTDQDSTASTIAYAGPATQVQGLPPIDGLYVADNYSVCVVDINGDVWTWGQFTNGVLGTNATQHAYLPAKVTGITNPVVKVSSSEDHVLALDDKGNVWAWGRNNQRQLGDNTTSQRNAPVMVLTDCKDVLAGNSQWSNNNNKVSFAIKNDGTLYSWGQNNYGQLGDGTGTTNGIPKPVLNMSDTALVKQTDGRIAAALKEDKSMWTWGSNGVGQMGDGTIGDKRTPSKILDNVVSFALGDETAGTTSGYMTAVKADRSVWQWGYNGFPSTLAVGKLKNGHIVEPFRIPADKFAQKIAVPTPEGEKPSKTSIKDVAKLTARGSNVTFMTLKTDGTVWYADDEDAFPIPGISGAKDIVGNTILLQDGTLWSWGVLNGFFTRETAPDPVQVPGGITDVVEISANYFLTGDGTMYKWNGDPATVPAVFATDVRQMYTDANELLYPNYIIKNDDSVWVWGCTVMTIYGQAMGIGPSAVAQPVPVKVMDGVDSLFTGGTTTVVKKTDNSWWGWGADGTGLLCKGASSGVVYYPEPFVPNDVKTVAMGTSYTYIIKNDDSLWGTGTTMSSWAGVGVPAKLLEDVPEFKVNNASMFFQKADGSVWAFGSNNYGQLGLGDKVNRYDAPVEIPELQGATAIGVANSAYSYAVVDGELYMCGQFNGKTEFTKMLF